MNKRRQTLKPLENKGFFCLSLLYRNGILTPACSFTWAFLSWPCRSAWGTKRYKPPWSYMDAQYWGKPRLVQRRKRIFLVADFRGQRSAEILFKPRDMFPIPPPCTDYGLPAAGASRISLDKTRGKIPVIRPFQERRMRSAAKSGNQSAFLASFGRPDEPFPTLLAKAVNMISFWYEGEEKDGVLRNLTPVECERLMGLPEGWTACTVYSIS